MTTGGEDEPYGVGYTEDALAMLEQTADRRVRGLILDRGDALANEPTKVGKPLVGELSGYRSIRAVGQRYRTVYRVNEPTRSVWIVAVGLRKQEVGMTYTDCSPGSSRERRSGRMTTDAP